jgi:hypothetical protein
MEKIIQSLINNWIRGVDTYTHNGSTWLIFTDSKRWVIELTEDKTLWYNYNFFKQIFEFTSLNVVDNQQYITKWVEDNVMNKVKDTRLEINITEGEVDDIIQDGVKRTQDNPFSMITNVENTIQNGVKETKSDDFNVSQFLCEEVIDKGVKETKISPTHTEYGDWLDGDVRLDEIIENGVKETNHVDVMKFFDNKMEDTLENGVKFTLNTEFMPKSMVEDIIENGVKSSFPRQYVGEYIIDKIIDKGVIETHDDVYHHKGRIDGVIKNGVKETKHANKYNSIGPVIKEGKINDIIDNGVKVSGTFVGGNRQKENIESVIGYGTKNPTD